MGKNVPDVLFHYCTLETFYNIVGSKSIWLSDISKSNDSQELIWFKSQCRSLIYKAWLEYVQKLDAEDRLLEADFNGFQPIADHIDDFIQRETTKCWAFCLSEKSDDLGQWRGYASDGSGIAIGFKSDLFENLNSLSGGDFTADPQMYFDKIEYSYDSILELLNHACKLNDINASLSCSEVLRRLNTAAAILILGAPLYKNEKFAEEKEWRMAITLTLGKLLKGMRPEIVPESFPIGVTLDYDYAINNGRLVSHVAVQHENLFEYVSEIWLGPKCKVSEMDMKLFLISKGWLTDQEDNAIVIHRSEASYR